VKAGFFFREGNFMVRIELKEIVSNYDNKRKALNAVERGNKKTIF